jgi:hypothetical protein
MLLPAVMAQPTVCLEACLQRATVSTTTGRWGVLGPPAIRSLVQLPRLDGVLWLWWLFSCSSSPAHMIYSQQGYDASVDCFKNRGAAGCLGHAASATGQTAYSMGKGVAKAAYGGAKATVNGAKDAYRYTSRASAWCVQNPGQCAQRTGSNLYRGFSNVGHALGAPGRALGECWSQGSDCFRSAAGRASSSYTDWRTGGLRNQLKEAQERGDTAHAASLRAKLGAMGDPQYRQQQGSGQQRPQISRSSWFSSRTPAPPSSSPTPPQSRWGSWFSSRPPAYSSSQTPQQQQKQSSWSSWFSSRPTQPPRQSPRQPPKQPPRPPPKQQQRNQRPSVSNSYRSRN